MVNNMGTPYRERKDCKQCGSEDSGRVIVGPFVDRDGSGRKSGLHMVKCLQCDFFAEPQATPDMAFEDWDKLNKTGWE